jgi:excisionase family DNA binding protein
MINREGSSDILTAGEVARLLHLHINTVRRWSNNGIIKAHRSGPRRDRMFSMREITRHLSGGKPEEEIYGDGTFI